MVNVLYDFNGLTPWFVPYLGVGDVDNGLGPREAPADSHKGGW
jgi:hypothetical protein